MRFARFLAVGAIAAAANFGARIVIDRWTGLTTAVVLAYLVGMATAYQLNRRYVSARPAGTGRERPPGSPR